LAVLLFQTGDSRARSYLPSDPVFWEGEGLTLVESNPVIVRTGREAVDSTPDLDAYNLLKSDPDVKDYDDWDVNSAPYLKCLFHRHFTGMELLKVSQVIGNPWRFENDIDYGRVHGPLPKIESNKGTTSRSHSGPVTGNSLSTTTPDNSKVIIIDPVQGLVRVLNNEGDVLFREILGLDVFADVITITSDNETYWLLRWVSANHNGGNRFNIERRRIEDHTIVEMTWETFVESNPEFHTDRILESAPELEPSISFLSSNPLLFEGALLRSVPVLDTIYAIESDPEFYTEHSTTFVSSVPVFFQEGTTLQSKPVLDYPIGRAGLSSSPSLVHDEWIVTDPVLTDVRSVESSPVLLPHSYGIVSDPVLTEVRIELRLPSHKVAPFHRMYGYNSAYHFPEGIRAADERNLFPSYYNLENDVHRIYNPIWPVRVSEAQHEMPYHETEPLYYGHPLHFKAAKDGDFELDDLFYVPDQRLVNENALMKTSHVTSERVINTRQVTAPHLVSSETRLVFGTVKHRGAWPWENEHVDEEDPQRRSSKTLFTEIDPDTRWPISANKCVNASAAAGIKANDQLGIVIMDFYWRTTFDGHLPKFTNDSIHDIEGPKVKCMTLMRLDFSFEKQAVLPCILPKYRLEGEDVQYDYEQLPLGENPYPYVQVLSTVNRSGQSWFAGTGIMNLAASETSFNGLFHLVEDHIVWLTDQMLASTVHEPRQEYGYNSTWHYPWDTTSEVLRTPGDYTKPHNRIQILDRDLNSKAEFYTDIPHTSFLCVSMGGEIAAISSEPSLLPYGYFDFIISEPILRYFGQSTPLVSDPELITDMGILSDPELITDRGILSDPILSPAGYTENIVLITNSSLVEAADMFSENRAGDNNRSHPTGQTGTYPYGVRYWEIGIGYPTGKGFLYPREGIAGYYTPEPGYEEWGGDALYHNPALCWRPKLPKYYDDFDPARGVFDYFNDENFPQPIQFISDNDNQALFGLFRLPEGRTWMSGYQEMQDIDGDIHGYYDWYMTRGPETGYLFNRHDNIGSRLYPDQLGFEFEPYKSACVSYPIGGVLHKYNRPNEDPIKSVIIPGFLKNNTTKEYDPYVTCRYFGHSPTEKKLYVIRALGRPDFFHTSMRTFVMNQSSPWVRLPDDGYTYKLNEFLTEPDMPSVDNSSAALSDYPDLYIAYHPYDSSPSYTFGPPDLRGWMPDDNNVMLLDTRDYTPWNHYDYIMTMENHVQPYGYSWEEPGTDENNRFIQHKTETLENYEQKPNTYEVRDILVFDYNLQYLRKIPVPEAVPDDEVILHLTERDGTYYLLTQKKAETSCNWAQFHATRGIGTPLEHGYQDDKYGYKFSSVKLYKVNALSSSSSELIVELPWAGHSVGDILIQEITDTHAWLNWSGVHKTRAGTCMGMAVRLDGTGYEEIPGALAIVKDHHVEGKWTVLVYKNSSSRPSFFHRRLYGEFRRHQAERWNRYGDGRVTTMVILDESTLLPIDEEVAYQPMNDTPRLTARDEEVGMTKHPDEFYPNAPQPGYSQFYKRRYQYFMQSDPVLIEDPESAKPRTWIMTTTGGPAVTNI